LPVVASLSASSHAPANVPSTEPLPEARQVPLDLAPSPTASARTHASSTASTTAAPTPTASVAPGDPFDREKSLLERARSALVRHDAQAADEALSAAERQFPRSRHEEERDYLRIQVLREQGDGDGARTRAKAFLAKYPESFLRSRVEPLAR
jgi:hypothetical protein